MESKIDAGLEATERKRRWEIDKRQNWSYSTIRTAVRTLI